jgi:hypothetical protein
MKKTTEIIFLRRWRGREPGHIDSALDYGVAQLLVQRGIAQWRAGEVKPERRRRYVASSS